MQSQSGSDIGSRGVKVSETMTGDNDGSRLADVMLILVRLSSNATNEISMSCVVRVAKACSVVWGIGNLSGATRDGRRVDGSR